jgi:ComF family protein
MALRDLASNLIDVLAPPTCPGCGKRDSHGSFCDGCRGEVVALEEPWCETCAAPSPDHGAALCPRCRSGRAFRRARALARFEGPLTEWMARMKYRGDKPMAGALGRLAAEAAARTLDPSTYDAVVAVPLHPDRLVERGFNQSVLIAQVVAAALGVPVVPALVRTRGGPAQVGLADDARADNVAGVFALNPPHVDDLKDLSVLLIDDVLTTGATADACAEALLCGGVAAVDVLTVARTS